MHVKITQRFESISTHPFDRNLPPYLEDIYHHARYSHLGKLHSTTSLCY